MSQALYNPTTGRLVCDACGAEWQLTLPCPLSIAGAVFTQWGRDHRRCKSAKIAPRGKGGGK